MPIETVTSCNPTIISAVNGYDGNIDLLVNEDAMITKIKMPDSVSVSAFEENVYSIKEELNLIKEEYENKLQRQKVHISRGDRVQGSRIYGRGRKITIPKRSFRNKKGIIGFSTDAK